MKGPFQYSPFTIDHPGQPDDDYSIKDPTVKTLDRSKLCLSPFNVNNEISNERISFIQEASSFQLLAFTQKSQETTKGFKNEKKLKTKFAELLRDKIKLNDKVKKYSYIFDLEQQENTPLCIAGLKINLKLQNFHHQFIHSQVIYKLNFY